MKTLLALAILFLAACVQPRPWYPTGQSDDLTRAKYECEFDVNRSEGAFAGQDSPYGREDPYARVGNQANRMLARDSMFNRCMAARGYAR